MDKEVSILGNYGGHEEAKHFLMLKRTLFLKLSPLKTYNLIYISVYFSSFHFGPTVGIKGQLGHGEVKQFFWEKEHHFWSNHLLRPMV